MDVVAAVTGVRHQQSEGQQNYKVDSYVAAKQLTCLFNQQPNNFKQRRPTGGLNNIYPLILISVNNN